MDAFKTEKQSWVAGIAIVMIPGGSPGDHQYYELGQQELPLSFDSYKVAAHLKSAYPTISFLVSVRPPGSTEGDDDMIGDDDECTPHLGSQERYVSVSPHFD